MAKRKRPSGSLIDAGEKFALELLERARTHKLDASEAPQDGALEPEPPTLQEQAAVLAVVTRWVQTQHKIKPEKEDDDWLTTAQRKLTGDADGGTPRRRARGATAASGTPAANGHARPELPDGVFGSDRDDYDDPDGPDA